MSGADPLGPEPDGPMGDLPAPSVLVESPNAPRPDDPLTRDVADMLARVARNYDREGSGPGSRFEGRLLEDVQAERSVREIRERLFAELGNDHYVIFTEDRWTVEHSVECRLSGHMPECEYHTAVAAIADEPRPETLGRWRIAGIDAAGFPILQPAEPAP